MFPKVLPRHANLAGTVFYLFSLKGEHTDPHVVAAWDPTLPDSELAWPDKAGRRRLVDLLDAPRVLFGKEPKHGHVYHVPISLPAADGVRDDAWWREVIIDAVEQLELGPTANSAGCRWIAVHHGLSKNGNDHVHLVVQLVGEDGKVPRLSFDKRRWRAWAEAVEERLGLTRTGRAGTGARSLSRAEIERAARTGNEPERRQLERMVRAAAAGADNEVEFVQTARRNGAQLRARIEHGQVVGYSASLLPVADREPTLRLGGGQLARDLSLPHLRTRWSMPDEHVKRASPTCWTVPPPCPDDWHRAWWTLVRDKLNKTTAQIHQLDTNDRVRWNAAVDQAADLLAVIAVRLEPTARGPLHQTADHLAAAARLDRPAGRKPRPVVLPLLVEITRIAAHSADPVPAVALGLLAALAVLLCTLATRQRHHQYPGQSGAHLHRAAEQLAGYRRAPRERDVPPVELAVRTAAAVLTPPATGRNRSPQAPAPAHRTVREPGAVQPRHGRGR